MPSPSPNPFTTSVRAAARAQQARRVDTPRTPAPRPRASLMPSGVAWLVALTVLCGLSAAPIQAQDAALGYVDFPTSATAAAQSHFVKGVLLMHSFEYEDAATHFRMAQEADPDFALAYWGEAMSHNHPIWMQQDRAAAVAILDRLAPTPEARAAKAGTERERAWLHAAEVLYGTVPPALGKDKHARDDLYGDAMRRLYERFPDHEAAANYALAILGTAHEGRDFATYMRAAAVVDHVFDENPNHPGAAHYLIHSYDDPVHAPLGLPMARAYAKIAPAAGHAQHMTSHIFVAMGMWEDVVSANEAARDVQNARLVRLGRLPNVCGHYTYWLEYGYLQQGRYGDAKQVLDTCYERIQGTPSSSELGYFASMRARYVLDTGDFDVALRYAAHFPTPHANAQVIDALAAGADGDLTTVRAIHADLERQAKAAEGTGAGNGQTPVLAKVIQSALAHFEGRYGDAVTIAGEAAEMERALPYEFGPPAIVKPTFELLGEMLLAAERPEEAAGAFQAQLARTPLRTASLLGLARASAAAGDQIVASETYAQLAEIWIHADPGVEGLQEARTAEQQEEDATTTRSRTGSRLR